MKQCADYIGAPLPMIWGAAIIHNGPNGIKKLLGKK